jgi:hypothetical protein
LRDEAGTSSQRIQPAAARVGIQLAPSAAPPRRWSNRAVAAGVLGLMGLMATGGLILALMTVSQRRANDTGIKHKARRAPSPAALQPEAEPPARVVAPHKLEAIGYLPRDTGLIVGIHVADLLALPAGSQLLRQPFVFGKSQVKLASFADWTGLRLEDLDHLVLGLRMDQSLPPWFFVVARSRAPFDPESLRGRLHGERVANAANKGIFRYSAPAKVPLVMYCPDDRNAVVSLAAEYLESIPEQPVGDLAQLPEELQKLLRTRSEPASPLWVAGHVDNWLKSPARLFLESAKKEYVDRLTAIQTFGIWLELAGGARIKGSIRCKDADAARGLDEYFLAPRRAANPSLKTVVDGPWLNLQAKADLASVQKPPIP